MRAAMPRSLHSRRFGAGPPLVFVHGSAADHTTWSMQLALPLRQRFTLITVDRAPDGSVEEHAGDLAALIEDAGAPALVVGSSFGAVVVLDCARRHPALLRGMVLCEPPLPPSGDAPPIPNCSIAELDACAAEAGGSAAVEMFLRAVLGDETFDQMPRALKVRATAGWPALRADCQALFAYRVRYDQMPAVPALLLGGDRSPAYFTRSLDFLAARLPHARRVTLVGAGHIMHIQAPQAFLRELLRFADELDTGSATG